MNQSWILFFTIALAPPLFADELSDLSGAGTDEKLDRATFSNTQTWNKDFLAKARKRPRFLPSKWRTIFALPKPPANSSERTSAELDHLVKLSSERQAKLSQIQKEIEVTNFQFGDHSYKTLATDSKFGETGKAITAAYNDMAIAVFFFKERFNRVRPSLLGDAQGKEFGTAIKIPKHPAYPSGHATAVYMLAYLLRELDPPNADRYLEDASRIARNREVAGVHYPSDSQAGRSLGRQIADALLSNTSFRQQLEKAKAEWK
jgi:acid phosphatase (class A)